MSAATTLFPPEQPIYRLSVKQYHRMIEDGVLTDDDPVELIEGVLVFKMPKNDDHIVSVRRCRRVFTEIVPSGYFYDSEQPITLQDGEPEPDGMVIAGSIDDPQSVKPTSEQLLLVIEVSDSTLDRDRGIKLRTYARAGISCYWIVNLIDRQIEVQTEPDTQAVVPSFLQQMIYKPGEAVPFSVGDKTVAIAVSDLLPAL